MDVTETYLDSFPPDARALVDAFFRITCHEWIEGQPAVDDLLRATAARLLRAYRAGSQDWELLDQVYQSLSSPAAEKFAAFVIKQELSPANLNRLALERAQIIAHLRWLEHHKKRSSRAQAGQADDLSERRKPKRAA